jgi:hypothetical protein
MMNYVHGDVNGDVDDDVGNDVMSFVTIMSLEVQLLVEL